MDRERSDFGKPENLRGENDDSMVNAGRSNAGNSVTRSDQKALDSSGGSVDRSQQGPGQIAPIVPPFPKKQESKSTPTRPSSRLFSFVFFLMTVCLIWCVIWLGPVIVERYQYAITRGKIRAEYENAAAILEQEPLRNVSQHYQLVAQKISPSVVKISAGVEAKKGRFSRLNILQGGQGSGVILSSDGYIMTNFHVVKDAIPKQSNVDGKILVALPDRSREPAELVGYDELADLAVLKVERNDLIAAEWGNSNDLRVGSMVWAVGSPYGFDNSITAGIVSGKKRSVMRNENRDQSALQEFIQTDAAVNPGNSGGPLVDSQGKVVGINTQIYGEKFQGISFAVPSSDAKFVFEQIRDQGVVKRGYLGVQLHTPGNNYQRRNVRQKIEEMDFRKMKGALVIDVTSEQSAAARAGMKPFDQIVKWDGIEVEHEQHLFALIGRTSPNQKVNVRVIRNGKALELVVRVGDRDVGIWQR